MTIGKIWPAEWSAAKDSRSGVTVRQLTNYKGHSHHLYFTNSGWYANNQKLLFGSDRGNRTNLFSLDLNSGEITQLTDLPPIPLPYETSFLEACLNPTRDEAYFWHDGTLMALDLEQLDLRPLWRVPSGYVYTMLSCTADGKYICTNIYEDLSQTLAVDLLRGYVGFEEIWAARPRSKIMRIPVDGASDGATVVWEESYWIGHVNTSPTRSNLLTFCHEGPWDKIDNRIWGLDHTSGEAWMIRPRGADGASVGHEHWHTDGIFIGYHGRKPSGAEFFGTVRFDDQERQEVATPHADKRDFANIRASRISHYHANDSSLIVGDAGTTVHLWHRNEDRYEPPRILCEHQSSMHIQQLHVHPRFSPNGREILFTSDKSGYGNLYLAPIPAIETLPLL